MNRVRLMELAGVPIKETTASEAIAAITKNKAALTVAISKRLKNAEDTSAYEAVETLLIKTAIDAGVPKKYAEDFPWMEGYAVPGESTVKDDLQMLEEDLTDMIENPEMMAATPANTKKVNSAQIISTFEKAASQGVYLLGKTAFSQVFSRLMNARPKDTRLEGSNEFRWLYSSNPTIVKDGSNVYLLFLDKELIPTDPSGVVMIVQVKNDKFIQDVYVAKSPKTNQYTDPRSGTKEAINLKDRLVAKVVQAGIVDKEKREMLGDQPSLNPALNGKVKVPECSAIQSQLSTVSESLHEQLLRAAKNKL